MGKISGTLGCSGVMVAGEDFRDVRVSGCNGRNPRSENVRETEGKQRNKGVEIGTEQGAFLTNMLNPFHYFIHEFNNQWVKMEDV